MDGAKFCGNEQVKSIIPKIEDKNKIRLGWMKGNFNTLRKGLCSGFLTKNKVFAESLVGSNAEYMLLETGEKAATQKSTASSGYIEGYKDIKFGMTYNQIKAAGICGNFADVGKYDPSAFASDCYKVAGKKRNMMFYFTRTGQKDLKMIHIALGDSTTEFFNKLVKGIGKKYKETYRLTREQQFTLNKGDMIVFFADNRITLREISNEVHLFYTREVSPLYTKFAPKDVSTDDF